MKSIKTILSVVLLSLTAETAIAQEQLVIKLTDGSKVAYYIDGVNKMYADGERQEHEYVDLGLSVKWATCNVGAENCYGYGYYFAWGETEPYRKAEKNSFSWSTYKWMTEGQSSWAYVNKYQYADGQTSACWYDSNGSFIGDGKTVLEAADDAATANWGSDWRMPTYDEFSELNNTNNCSWTWYASGNTEFNGVAGYKVQSKKTGYTDKYIFLPAAGYRYNSSLYDTGYRGYYWSSSLYEYVSNGARCLYFYSSLHSEDYYGDRFRGLSVRPVTDATNISQTIDMNNVLLDGIVNDNEYEIDETVGGYVPTITVKYYNNILMEGVDYNITIKDADGNEAQTPLTVGTYTLTVSGIGLYTGLKSVTFKVLGKIQDHVYVDLGLSVKWATCNVGAENCYDYGDYFAWGETIGYNSGKTSFSWSTYKYCNGSYDSMTKYCTSSSYGTVDNKDVLEATDDAATVNWGSDWRMPTHNELSELQNTDNCSWTWYAAGNAEFNGVAGYKVQSKKTGYTDNYIFLPAAGDRYNSSLYNAGNGGFCWSSSLYEGLSYSVRHLDFSSSCHGMGGGNRCSGESVRPVTE